MKKLVWIALVVAACGDNHSTARSDADAAVDGAVNADAQGGPPPASKAVALGTDYDQAPPGELASVNLDTLHVTQISTIATDDPLLKKVGDKLVVINRDTNNVTILKAVDLGFVTQIGTGAGSNPQDVAIVGNNVYVPAMGTAGVVVGHLDGTPNTTIDLNQATGETDGKPDCVGAAVVGGDLYVTCERLAGFVPEGDGVLVVIDTATNTVRTHLALPKPNPAPYIAPHGTDLWIGTYNDFSAGTATGCIAKITTGATPTATCVIDNTALGAGGGGPNSLTIAGDTMWISYSDLAFTHAWARSYDLATATLAAANLTPDALTVHDVVGCPDGHVVITEGTRTAIGGVRMYKGATEVTTAALSIGLEPVATNGLVCY